MSWWRWCVVLLAAALPVAASATPCAPPPPPLRDLVGMGYYSDRAGSVVDPVRQAANRAMAQPLDDFMRQVAGRSDRYLAQGDRDVAQCALAWLASWAQGGALLGTMRHVNNDQADYMRQWALASLGVGYLKVRALADGVARAEIEPWLRAVARANLAYWDNPKKTRNNHYYWTGLGIMAAALASDDQALLTQARSIYRQGIDDIQDDGSLPLEMRRGRRALLYHNYALMPLVEMAALAHLRAEDWYGYRDGRIDLLVRRVTEGYRDTGWFAQRAGVTQEGLSPPGEAGWVELYRLRAADAGRFDELHRLGPYRSTQMGGNVTLMAASGPMAR